MRQRALLGLALVVADALAGCVRAPSPLNPSLRGSIGLPHLGVLTEGARLEDAGPAYRRLRRDARRYGTPTLVHAIERAAGRVAGERPGSVLVVGDLSLERGGHLVPHLSHRTGRDADLLLYVTSLQGAPLVSPGFVHFGPDGLAWDPMHRRFVRFDVEREWLLVKALVLDEDVPVQWIFINHALKPLLLEWARASGEDVETIRRADAVMLEPRPGGVHDDHTHVRVACSAAEVERGCEPNGPARDWQLDELAVPEAPADDELVRAIVTPPLAPLVSR